MICFLLYVTCLLVLRFRIITFQLLKMLQVCREKDRVRPSCPRAKEAAEMFPHLLVNLAGDAFLGSEVGEIPPGDVKHVGVNWDGARLVEGHEEDAVSNLGSDPSELHQLSPCLQQWPVAQT